MDIIFRVSKDNGTQKGMTNGTHHTCNDVAFELIQGGPSAHMNWRAGKQHVLGRPYSGLTEAAVYCDAKVVGDLTPPDCPYDLLNTVPPLWSAPSPSFVFPLVMRVEFFLTPQEYHVSPLRPDDSRYVNLDIADEIACLISLVSGRRLKAGESIRTYYGGEPFGRPHSATLDSPFLLSRQTDRSTLPRQRDMLNLAALDPIFLTYPSIHSEMALALVRSARFYRDAISIGEREPELCWLLLVSAVETAANYWYAEDGETATDLLKRVRPEFFDKIQRFGPGPTEVVAQELAHTLQATKKFLKYFQKFYPRTPPTPRPKRGMIDWRWNVLRKRIRKVYEIRSAALHAGAPIPHPMCDEVKIDNASHDGYPETLWGGGQASGGGSWSAEDIPMYLHTFEYLARGALLSWWKEETVGYENQSDVAYCLAD